MEILFAAIAWSVVILALIVVCNTVGDYRGVPDHPESVPMA